MPKTSEWNHYHHQHHTFHSHSVTLNLGPAVTPIMHTWPHASSTRQYMQVYCIYTLACTRTHAHAHMHTCTHTHTHPFFRLSGPQSLNSLEVYACHILNIRACWMLLRAWTSGALEKTVKRTLNQKQKKQKHLLVISLRHIIVTKRKSHQHKRKGESCDKWEIVQEMVPISTLSVGVKE